MNLRPRSWPATVALRVVLPFAAMVGVVAGPAPEAAAAALQRPAEAAAAAPDSSRLLPDGLNVAIGARVHSASGSSADTDIRAAVDGDATTRWCPGTGGVTTLRVDLGRPRLVTGIGVTFANKRPNDYASYSVAYASAPGQPAPYPGPARAGPHPIDQGPLYLHGSAEGRYFYLTFRTARITTPCVSEFRVFSPVEGAERLDLGADLSTLKQSQVQGWKYSAGGVERPVLEILRSGGMNYARLRLWVDPSGNQAFVPNLANTLDMARQAKQAGMKVLLNLHLSHTWADPDAQALPPAWRGQSLDELTATVRRYTETTVRAFADQGTPVDQVAVGNEITQGFMWPAGALRLDADGRTEWGPFTQLLKAGIEGARAGNPAGHRMLVQVHIDAGGDNPTSRQFFDAVQRAGVDYDVIGLSYYVWAHGSLASLRANLLDLANRYGKKVEVAEIQYPWEPIASFAGGDPVYPELAHGQSGYPFTPEGAASLMRDVISITASLPGGAGQGVFWWNALDRGGRAPFGMFDRQGNALDVVNAYRIGRQ